MTMDGKSEAENTPVETLLITGGIGCGKTHRLIELVKSYIDNGSAGQSVCVMCASPLAVSSFETRLREVLGATPENVRILTAREAALEVLSDPEARRFTGREPRVLTPYEEQFFLEDIKLSALRGGRIKQMLRFFYRSWTELAEENPNWLISDEERGLHDMVKTSLSRMQAYLEPEVAATAVSFLRSRQDALTRLRYNRVLVDDVCCMSRASQQLACLLADTGIVFAGEEAACVEVYDSYPYAAGLKEFAEAHPGAQALHLDTSFNAQGAVRAANKIKVEYAPEEPMGIAPECSVNDLRVVNASTPDEELETIAELVKKSSAFGKTVVSVPNKYWAHNVCLALQAHDIPFDLPVFQRAISGDVREYDSCVNARLLTLLRLAARPGDTAAWRCWCGFGDYIARSLAVKALFELAESEGITFAEALEQVSEAYSGTANGTPDSIMQEPSMAETIAAYRKGRAALSSLALSGASMRGRRLLDELARLASDGCEEKAAGVVCELCLGDDGDTAEEMLTRAYSVLNGLHSASDDVVWVVPYNYVVGLNPDTLIISGFVNGFIPCREYFDASLMSLEMREKTRVIDLHRTYAMIGAAKNEVIISTFSSAPLEDAKRMKLEISRIRMDDGVRIALIKPSVFLELL